MSEISNNIIDRKQYIDAVGGLMILWMIFGHLQQVTGFELVYPNLLFFFMPWFYYKAGALHIERGLAEVANRGGRKLFKPFVVYGIVGQIILVICFLLENETSMKPYLYSPIRSLVLEGTSPGNPPLWFIPSLFVVQCLYAYLHSKQIRKYQCALIGLLGGLLLMAINYKFVPAYIGSGMMGLFYYSMGKILHTYEGKWKVVLGCVLLCITLLLLDSIPNADVRHIAQYKGNVWDLLHGAATATCGCFIINSLIKYIQPILKFPILRFIGIHAMEFYVIHWIVLLIIARLIMGDLLHIYDEQLQFLISGLGCALLIPIFIFFKNKWLSQKTY